MICRYVSFVLNGLYAETKKQASCIDVLSSDTAACFYYIKEISATEA